MTPFAALTVAGCLAVHPANDRITAGDLAAAIPGLTAASSDESVAFAPAPGVQRLFHVPELRRLALRLHWNVQPTADICVERPVSPPDPARFLAAMRQALPHASIEILDYSRQAIPEGDLEFPPTGLRDGPGRSLWLGYIRYAGSRRYNVWARVNVSITVTRVVAATDLRPGEAIGQTQLRVETVTAVPSGQPFVDAIERAAGQWPRVAIRAGTAIRADMLAEPKAIARGDTVQVNVQDGAAHLEFQGQAEAAGSIGQTIPVSNPISHKRFFARIEAKGKVSVVISGAAKESQ